LENVRLYLAPYKSIWKNLRISNKYCVLRLGSDGATITGMEKVQYGTYRKFKIIESQIHTMAEVWDMFCLNFEYTIISLLSFFELNFFSNSSQFTSESSIPYNSIILDFSDENLYKDMNLYSSK
jgi:hypothetical protein